MPLGRGLNALITSTTKGGSSMPPKDDNNEGKVWNIPVTRIVANPDQPRKHFAPIELEELSQSIKEHGILQPLLVVENENGTYEIVAGERRFRAAQLAGLPTVPAIVKKLPERQILEISLIENIQRENLNPLEEAFAYKRLIEEFGMTQQEVSEKMGKSRPAIANTVRLLDLPELAQKALTEKKISATQARTLLSLENNDERLNLLSSMLGEKITVRELEREVAKKKIATNSNTNWHRDPNLMYLEEKLRDKLNTKVTVTKRGGQGTISISYYSDEELAQLIRKLTE